MLEQTELINRAVELIEANLTAPITVTAVAATIGYSRFHLVRLFRAVTGMTLIGYLRARRLHEAARALLTSPKPILEIALDYQFQSQEAFSRAFRAAYHCTPGIYRRRKRYRRHLLRITIGKPQLFLPFSTTSRMVTVHSSALVLPQAISGLSQHKPDRVLLYYR